MTLHVLVGHENVVEEEAYSPYANAALSGGHVT